MGIAVSVNFLLVELVKGLAFSAGVGDVGVEEDPLVPGSDSPCTNCQVRLVLALHSCK